MVSIMNIIIGVGSIFIGLGIIFVSTYYLYKIFPEKAKDQDTIISIYALKQSAYLTLLGIALVLIGFLYLMYTTLLS